MEGDAIRALLMSRPRRPRLPRPALPHRHPPAVTAAHPAPPSADRRTGRPAREGGNGHGIAGPGEDAMAGAGIEYPAQPRRAGEEVRPLPVETPATVGREGPAEGGHGARRRRAIRRLRPGTRGF